MEGRGDDDVNDGNDGDDDCDGLGVLERPDVAISLEGFDAGITILLNGGEDVGDIIITVGTLLHTCIVVNLFS